MNEIKYPSGCKDIQADIPNDELIRRLKKIQQAYQNIEQGSDEKYKELAIYLGSDIFLQHEHEDVQLLVACCLADIFRIYAPESPYEDPENLKKIFLFLANQLKGLKDHANTSFKRYFYLLENLECVKTFNLCLELDDSQEIISNLFDNVFKTISEKHTPKVQTLLFELLHPLLNESDQISIKTIEILLTKIIEPQKSNNKEAHGLAVSLIKKGGEHFEYHMQNQLNNIVLMGRGESGILYDKMCLIIYELNVIRPSLLELALPQLEYKLKSPDLKERREYTKLLSKMFSEKESKLATNVPQLWESYLERFSDENCDIRKICVETTSEFLLNHKELYDQLMEQIKSRALDTEESIRYEMVQEILKALKIDNQLVNDDLLSILRDRILDIKIKVRKSVLQGLAGLYKKLHSKSSNKELFSKINWIPSKIMRMHFQDAPEDRLLVERLLNSSLVPYSLSTIERMQQLYYVYTILDEFSVLSLAEIMKDRVSLHQSMKVLIDSMDSDDDSDKKKVNDNLLIISRNLLEVHKGQEMMKALIKLFKENLNLKAHFKNLVNPTCSSAKSLELVDLILNNLNSLTQTNLTIAKRLIERMSSIIIDDEAFSCLLQLIELKIYNHDKKGELDYINDDGEKGLQLLNLILKLHSNRFNSESNYEKFHQFLKSKKDGVVSNSLKIIGSHFSTNKDKLEKTNNTFLPQLKAFIRLGTPKQAKYSIRCIFYNYSSSETILADLTKQILKEISIKNEKTYITLLVALGHLSFYIPQQIKNEMKVFVTQHVVKDILMNRNLNEQINNENKSRSKLAGKWCEGEDELPYETRIQLEAVKMLTRWCLGLKNECTSLISTMRVFVSTIKENGDISTSKHKTEPEKARLRLMCGTQLLKLAQETYFKTFITAEFFHSLARLIIDPVQNVREIFMKKLQKGLKSCKLSTYFMSIFVLSALDPNREIKSKAKKMYVGLVKTIRESNRRIEMTKQTNENQPKNLPENSLSFAISLLAHNIKIDSLTDQPTIKQIKDSLSFILDPLLDHPDGYQVAFIKKMLNQIKNSDDGLVSAILANAKEGEQLAIGTRLNAINRRLNIICEIASFNIHSKMVHVPATKEYPFDIRLPNGYFKLRESSTNQTNNTNNATNKANNNNSSPNDTSKQEALDLETTLAALSNDSVHSEANKSSGSIVRTSAKKRKATPTSSIQQDDQTTDNLSDVNNETNEENGAAAAAGDEQEDDNDENNDENDEDISLADLVRQANSKKKRKSNEKINKKFTKLTVNTETNNQSRSSSSSTSPVKTKNKTRKTEVESLVRTPLTKKKKLDTRSKRQASESSDESEDTSIAESPKIKLIPVDPNAKPLTTSSITITKINKVTKNGDDGEDGEKNESKSKRSSTRTAAAAVAVASKTTNSKQTKTKADEIIIEDEKEEVEDNTKTTKSAKQKQQNEQEKTSPTNSGSYSLRLRSKK